MSIKLLTEDDFTPRSFPAAARQFGRKVAIPADYLDKLSAANRARAFTIAQVNNARLLQQARNLLAKAIEDGPAWPQIRRQLLAMFDTAGVPPPALYRLRFAFEENVRQAYSDARRAVLDDPEITGVFAYRQYLTVGNGTAGYKNVRPEHAVLHLKVFAWDDPLWDLFTPPWDYGCRCSFIALTAGQVKRGRLTVWTYRGGQLRPVKGKGKRAGLKPNRRYRRAGPEGPEFDFSGLDDDLRRAIEAAD